MLYTSDDLSFFKAVWIAATTTALTYDLDASTPDREIFKGSPPIDDFRVERIFGSDVRRDLDFVVFGKGWSVEFNVSYIGKYHVGEWDDGDRVMCSSMSVDGDRSVILRDCMWMRLSVGANDD